MSATYGGQSAQWIIAPVSSPRPRAPEPEVEPQPQPAPQMTAPPVMSLDLPRFFYELEAFFQSAKKIETALQEERRMNAELREKLKRQEVELERRLGDTQDRLKAATEQGRKAHEMIQALQAQAVKNQAELRQAREQWQKNHDKAKAASAEVDSRGRKIEALERQLSETQANAQQATMDADLRAHEKDTEARTVSYERDGLLKKLRDMEIKLGQVEHRYRVEKDARERIEAYAKECYQQLLKEKQRR